MTPAAAGAGGSVTPVERHACFGGEVAVYRHDSVETCCTMRFAVFTPPQARFRPVPVLYYLPGLTCDDQTVMIKGGALQVAAELGLVLVASDTSPREPRLPGDEDSIEFGLAAGFYVDATEAPWSRHYRMYSYVTRELPALIAARFPVKPEAAGVFGDSMGGHGALVVALRNPDQYRSVSAFAPICAPMSCTLGQNAFSRYLGRDRGQWAQYDASALLARSARPGTILIDQGTADEYLEDQLQPALLAESARKSGQALELRMQPGYDHDWYFISTFMADHLRFHASRLGA